MAAVAAPAAAAAPAPVIHVLSTRPDLVSGGDALVRIALPDGSAPSKAAVTLNGKDVSDVFAVRSDHRFEGLLTGLAPGANTLVATLPSGAAASLPITNHPQSGPLFSGPQIAPWTCNAGAKGPACDRAPAYSYKYLPAGTADAAVCTISQCESLLQSYDPSNPPPAPAIATTTTDQGKTVPFIVRIETGSLNR